MEPRSLRQLRGHRSFSEPLPITFIFAARYFFSRPHPFRCAPHGHRPCGSESVIAAAYQATTFPEDVGRNGFATQSTSRPCAVRRTHWLPLLVPSAKTSNIDGAKQRAYRRPPKHQRKLRILPRYGDAHAGSPARPRPAGTLRERLPGLRALEAETNRRKELYSFKQARCRENHSRAHGYLEKLILRHRSSDSDGCKQPGILFAEG
jgi:hypothetical protein